MPHGVYLGLGGACFPTSLPHVTLPMERILSTPSLPFVITSLERFYKLDFQVMVRVSEELGLVNS